MEVRLIGTWIFKYPILRDCYKLSTKYAMHTKALRWYFGKSERQELFVLPPGFMWVRKKRIMDTLYIKGLMLHGG